MATLRAKVKEKLKRSPLVWRVLYWIRDRWIFLIAFFSQEYRERVYRVYFERGNQGLCENKLEEAIACYECAIALQPDSAAAYFFRGTARSSLGQLDDAIADYQQAIALEPHWAVPYLDLGNLLMQRENVEEALKNYNQAIVLQ
ncbi:MAG: tetratricopeptide repeat protein, partial [Cyanobacteriota bacterium]|nr:tetratricopeptide repeat protein [Cyanobacteriota bacterium]